jgi:[ribosomal protein S5]-alanine N-acetyltransferase
MHMPPLQTARLLIRPLTLDDLDAVYQILDVELSDAAFGSEGQKTLEDRRRWLQWTVLQYEELARLYQPPYGDRAVVLRATGEVIGAAGYVPCLDAFGQLGAWQSAGSAHGLRSTEFGLFYAISPRHQRQGYASEAARALIDYAFDHLRLARVVATTTDDNHGSIGVMEHVGMTIHRNPFPDPPWLQIVGVIEPQGETR